MPMFEGSVPSNLSFKKGCDKSCLKNMDTLQEAHTREKTLHMCITDTRSPCGTVCSGLLRMGQVHHSHTQPCGTVRSGLSRMGQVHHSHTQPMWYSPQRTLTHGTSTSQTHTAHVVQSTADSHPWDKYITDTHSPCGTVRSELSRMEQVHHRHTQPMWYSPQRTLTHGTSTSQSHTAHVVQSAADSHAWDKYITVTHSPCGTVRSGLSRMGQVHHRHTQPMWYSPQRTLTHGTSTSQTHTAHVVQSAADSHAWDKYITVTHSPCGTVRSELSRMGQVHRSHTQPCGTVRSGLSRMGQVHHSHTQPMWYSPQRTLTHGTSTSQTHTAHVVQSAADSHAWDKYITDTHSPCGTVRSGLPRMGQVHHRHTQPMWYSPQRTLTHGTSTSQTHTARVVQSTADSHPWDKYITDTHSPCGTVRSGLSRMGQVHHSHTQPMWYSPQRTLTHGTSTSQTHTAHVVQSAADSHAWDKYITVTHSPCGTVRSELSRMGQVHHSHTQPCGTVRSGLSRMGQVHHRHTQPMWYSPQRTLTHGTSTSQTHTAHVVQSAADSHAWDKYITVTHSPCGTVRSGLSRMGQVHHRHTQPMWYSPQRTLTHGTSTSQTHTAHVVQSTADSHAWDKYITVTHSPCGTVRSELSRMGQVHHRHTQPMWYSPQRTLTHGTSTSQSHTAHVVQSAADSHAWDKYITDTHSPCGTVRSGLSRMGQVHHSHTQPMWYSPQRTLTHGTSTSQTHTAHVVHSAADSHAWGKYITDTHYNIYNINLHHH